MESESFTQGEFQEAPKPKKKVRNRFKVLFWLALFLLVITVSFVAIKNAGWLKNLSSIVGLSNKEEGSGELNKFSDYSDVLAFIEGNEIEISNQYDSLTGTSVLKNTTYSTSDATEGWGYVNAPSGVPTSYDSYNSTDYSSTNVQVEGVDEGDIVKTDGNYIYIASDSKFVIVDAVPATDASIISKIGLDFSPKGLYINGDTLVVYGNNSYLDAYEEYDKMIIQRRSSYATLLIFDVSDRTRPVLEKEYAFEGSYQSSRMIGDFVYFVSATTPNYIYYNEEQPIPYILEDGKIMDIPRKPNVYYFDTAYTSQNFTSITAINVKDIDEDVESEMYMLDGNQNQMYVSEDNIYITFNKYTSEEEIMVEAARELIIPRLSEKERQRVAEIDSVSSYILNSSEKSAKISDIFEKYYASLSADEKDALSDELDAKIEEKYETFSREMQKTVIHKIAIDEGKLDYDTKGEVSGRVINQFAMDEDENGYFRIATIVDRSWTRYSSSEPSFNNVYVLDKNMEKIGEVEDIAEGETIYSVRFMQDRVYMVTFKTTDPLFVISLADPENPKVLGELKVPGYSTYLHPYDDTKIIGLGMQTNSSGWRDEGIKLSLFDVSDVSNPTEIDTYILGGYGSSSIALDEHKAFLFSKEKNLLVIPAIVTSAGSDDDYWGYGVDVTAAGSAVFTVDENGFELKGLIDHRADDEKDDSYYYVDGSKRNIYIGENLYSVSDNFLKINKISDLAEEKSIKMDSYIGGNNWSWE